jgi:hypothetical protein
MGLSIPYRLSFVTDQPASSPLATLDQPLASELQPESQKALINRVVAENVGSFHGAVDLGER